MDSEEISIQKTILMTSRVETLKKYVHVYLYFSISLRNSTINIRTVCVVDKFQEKMKAKQNSKDKKTSTEKPKAKPKETVKNDNFKSEPSDKTQRRRPVEVTEEETIDL